MGVGVDHGTLVDVSGLERGDRHHLQTGAGAEDVSELSVAELNHRDLGSHGDQVSHGDEVRNTGLR